MHTNLNKSGEKFYKNTNAQRVQINATAEERFQTNVKVTQQSKTIQKKI